MKNLHASDFLQPRRVRFFGARARAGTCWLAVLALALAMLALALSLLTNWRDVRQMGQQADQIDAIRNELARTQPAPRSATHAPHPDEVERHRRMVHQLNLPWANVLATLEELLPESVAMVAMEPAGSRGLRLQAEALSLDQLLAYAASLQSSEPFSSLVYTRHETNERDPNRPVRLNFEITLNDRASP